MVEMGGIGGSGFFLEVGEDPDSGSFRSAPQPPGPARIRCLYPVIDGDVKVVLFRVLSRSITCALSGRPILRRRFSYPRQDLPMSAHLISHRRRSIFLVLGPHNDRDSHLGPSLSLSNSSLAQTL